MVFHTRRFSPLLFLPFFLPFFFFQSDGDSSLSPFSLRVRPRPKTPLVRYDGSRPFPPFLSPPPLAKKLGVRAPSLSFPSLLSGGDINRPAFQQPNVPAAQRPYQTLVSSPLSFFPSQLQRELKQNGRVLFLPFSSFPPPFSPRRRRADVPELQALEKHRQYSFLPFSFFFGHGSKFDIRPPPFFFFSPFPDHSISHGESTVPSLSPFSRAFFLPPLYRMVGWGFPLSFSFFSPLVRGVAVVRAASFGPAVAMGQFGLFLFLSLFFRRRFQTPSRLSPSPFFFLSIRSAGDATR